jgi:hypothetical protein
MIVYMKQFVVVSGLAFFIISFPGQCAPDMSVKLPQGVTLNITNNFIPNTCAHATQTLHKEALIAQPSIALQAAAGTLPQLSTTAVLPGMYPTWLISGSKLIIACCIIGGVWYYFVRPGYERAWSEWRKELSLADLAEHQRSPLIATLLHEIQVTYSPASGSHTVLDALVRFVQDLSAEYAHLKRLKRIRSCVQVPLLGYMFSDNTQKINEITERLKRITWLKKTIAAYVTTMVEDKL